LCLQEKVGGCYPAILEQAQQWKVSSGVQHPSPTHIMVKGIIKVFYRQLSLHCKWQAAVATIMI
jgi:hypothetical protein